MKRTMYILTVFVLSSCSHKTIPNTVATPLPPNAYKTAKIKQKKNPQEEILAATLLSVLGYFIFTQIHED